MKSSLKPFEWILLESGIANVCLYKEEYKGSFFRNHLDDFDNGGNGYDWEFFAQMYLERFFPEMLKDIQFDSEYNMFCMFSENLQALEVFSLALKRATDNLEIMEEIWKQIREKYKVYVAVEFGKSNELVLSYVGIVKSPLDIRLKQHQSIGKKFVKLLMLDEFTHVYEAKGYEEIIEELMTNPMLNKGYLFNNTNNSIHPDSDQEFYTNAVTWAISDMKRKGYMSSNGELIILNHLLDKATFESTGEIIDGLDNNVTFYATRMEKDVMYFCMDVTSYNKELFTSRNKDGIIGSGYDWESIVKILIRNLCIDDLDSIFFDSEADLFCMYSKNVDKISMLISELKKLCENKKEFSNIVMEI